jgi:hypothetical protein
MSEKQQQTQMKRQAKREEAEVQSPTFLYGRLGLDLVSGRSAPRDERPDGGGGRNESRRAAAGPDGEACGEEWGGR